MIGLKANFSNRSIFFSISIFFALLLVSCSSSGLDEEEALRLVKEAMDYPKPVYKSYVVDDDAGRPMLKFLKGKGYLTGEYKSLGVGDNVGWVETEEGDEIIKTCTKWSCELKTYQKEVSGIREVLVDEEDGTARVMYEVTSSPTSLYYELRDAKGSPPRIYYLDADSEPDNGTPTTETHEITLKKWDKGWRATE